MEFDFDPLKDNNDTVGSERSAEENTETVSAEKETSEAEDYETSEVQISSGKKVFKDFIDVVESVIVALVASIFILTLLFRTGFVSGESMLTTMKDGDRYVVSGLFYTPQRGDIIVFEPDLTNYTTEEKLYVKRVIGIAGDHIEIKAVKNGDYTTEGENSGESEYTYHLYINGQLQQEEYLDSYQETRAYMSDISTVDANGNLMIDLTVPEGYMFVLGDNRVNSTDSRMLGCIDQRRIVGKILFRFFPFDKFGKVE